MPRPLLTRRLVRAYLDADQAAHLERIATGRNIDVPTLIAATLQPLLAAEEQGEDMFTVTLGADDVRTLRGTIERLCDDEPEPVNIDEEIPKWLGVYCRLGIERDADSN
jgi:hypothetical protein